MDVFHTINSGLVFSDKQSAVIIDGFHGGSGQGNSNTPDLLFQQDYISTLPDDISICFTHRHIDHYDRKFMQKFLSVCPDTRVLYEEIIHDDVLPSRERAISIEVNPKFSIHAFSSAHQGPQSMQTPHYCYLVSNVGIKYFVCGDAQLDRQLVTSVSSISGGSVTAAFVNVYHLGTEAERKLLRALNPEVIYIYHLPWPEEDRFNYRRIADKEVSELQDTYNLKILQPICALY